MLYYDRIDACKRIDVDKTSESKESEICHYWCFLSNWFNIQNQKRVRFVTIGVF